MLALTVLLLVQDPAEFRFPLEPLSPPTAAMGNAGAALEQDAEANLNPAGLLGAPRLSLYRYEGYDDYDGFVVASHLVVAGVAIGMGFRHFDYGTLIEDDLGGDLGDLTASEQAYSLKAATRIARGVSLGASVAHLSEDYFGSVTSATVASLGGLVAYSRRGAFGVALRNLGASATNRDFGTRYPLPTRLRAGLSHELPLGATTLLVASDVEVPLRDRVGADVHLGMDWTPIPFLHVRSGIESLANLDVPGERWTRWAAGVGVTIGRADLGLGARFGGADGPDELFFGVDAFR